MVSLIIPVPKDIIVLKITAIGRVNISYNFSHFPTMDSDTFCFWWDCSVFVRMLNLIEWMNTLSGFNQDAELSSRVYWYDLGQFVWLCFSFKHRNSQIPFISVSQSHKKKKKSDFRGLDYSNFSFKCLLEGVVSWDSSLLLKNTAIFSGQCKLLKSSVSLPCGGALYPRLWPSVWCTKLKGNKMGLCACIHLV